MARKPIDLYLRERKLNYKLKDDIKAIELVNMYLIGKIDNLKHEINMLYKKIDKLKGGLDD